MTWTRQPSTPPRLTRELGTNPLQLTIGGTLYPWTQHTAVHVARAATIDNPTERPATVTVQLVPGAVPAVTHGQWLTVALTDAALTAAGITLAADRAAARCRFVGRVSDVDVDKPDPRAAAVYTVTAVGTIRGLEVSGFAINMADSLSTAQEVRDFALPFLTEWTRPAQLPADAQWGVVVDATSTGPTRTAPFTDRLARTLLEHLAAAARDDGTTMVAEHRDGSIHYKAFGAPARSTTVGKHRASYRLEQMPPANDVTLYFGPSTPPDGTLVARNVMPNPSPTTTTAWTASNNTASASAAGYAFKPTNVAANGWAQQVSTFYSTSNGSLLCRVAGTVVDMRVAGGVYVQADYYNSSGTRIGQDLVGNLPVRGGSPLAFSLEKIVTPPSGTASVRLTLYYTAGSTLAGTNPTCQISAWHLITQGPGDIDPTEGLRHPMTFTGATPAGTEPGYRYAWAGTAGNSESRKLSDGTTTPQLYSRRLGTTTIASHGRHKVTLTADLAVGDWGTANTIAGRYLHAPGWHPPAITVDVLALLEEGSADALATARAVLALEVGDRVTPRALPADLPQASANAGAAVYVAGIDETISAHDWRLTFTLANRVHDL